MVGNVGPNWVGNEQKSLTLPIKEDKGRAKNGILERQPPMILPQHTVQLRHLLQIFEVFLAETLPISINNSFNPSLDRIIG